MNSDIFVPSTNLHTQAYLDFPPFWVPYMVPVLNWYPFTISCKDSIGTAGKGRSQAENVFPCKSLATMFEVIVFTIIQNSTTIVLTMVDFKVFV